MQQNMRKDVYAKALYPRFFIAPSGKLVNIGTMAKALAAIRSAPDVEVKGWEWYPVPGRMVLRQFRYGLDDRINRRGDNPQHGLSKP